MIDVHIEDIADALETTLNNYRRGTYTDLSFPLQKYVGMTELLKKRRVAWGGGIKYEWKLRTDNPPTTSNLGPFRKVEYNQFDQTDNAVAPYAGLVNTATIDEFEVDVNKDMAKIVDLAKIQEDGMMGDFYETGENEIWGAGSPSDARVLRGFNYIFPGATGTSGFTGANPSGYSDTFGVNRTNVTSFRHWNFDYQLATFDDLVTEMRDAMDFTYHKNPLASGNAAMGDVIWYVPHVVRQQLEAQARNQNDALRFDLAAADGKTTVRGAPIVWVPSLDSDTTQPIYMIRYDKRDGCHFAVKSGWYMKRKKPMVSPDQPTAIKWSVMMYWALVCQDPRRCARGRLAA